MTPRGLINSNEEVLQTLLQVTVMSLMCAYFVCAERGYLVESDYFHLKFKITGIPINMSYKFI